MEDVEATFDEEQAQIEQFLSNHEREQALKCSESARGDKLNELRQELHETLARQEEARLGMSTGSTGRWAPLLSRIAGMSWAYRVSRQRLRTWLRQVANNLTFPLLAVCPTSSRLLGILEPMSGSHIHLTPDSVADGALSTLPKTGAAFGNCVVELSDVEAPRVTELLTAIVARLNKPGTMLIHWHDRGTLPLRLAHNQIVKLAFDRGYQVSAYYAGSWASANALQAFKLSFKPPKWRRLLPLVRFAVLVVLAEFCERARRNELTSIPDYCSSAVFKIDLPWQEVVESAAPTALKLRKATVRRTQPAAREVQQRASSAMAPLPEERASGNP